MVEAVEEDGDVKGGVAERKCLGACFEVASCGVLRASPREGHAERVDTDHARGARFADMPDEPTLAAADVEHVAAAHVEQLVDELRRIFV